MEIHVCQRSAVPKKIKQFSATHLLSLIDDIGCKPHIPPSFNRQNWKISFFEDVIERNEKGAPTFQQIKDVLNWTGKLPDDARLLIHCEAGVSRSTAVALAVLVQQHGIENVRQCREMLLEIRPFACPNCLISEFADEILGCGGRLFIESEEIVKLRLISWNPNKNHDEIDEKTQKIIDRLKGLVK